MNLHIYCALHTVSLYFHPLLTVQEPRGTQEHKSMIVSRSEPAFPIDVNNTVGQTSSAVVNFDHVRQQFQALMTDEQAKKSQSGNLVSAVA